MAETEKAIQGLKLAEKLFANLLKKDPMAYCLSNVSKETRDASKISFSEMQRIADERLEFIR